MRRTPTFTKRVAVLLLLAVIGTSAPLSAFAQTDPQTPAPAPTESPSAVDAFCAVNITNPACAAVAAWDIAGDAAGNAVADVGASILFALATFILAFANLLLGIAGSLFNLAVVKTVFQFSTFLGNSPGLLTAWTILRDIGNMLLLFGFIFIGIAMILDLHSYPAKKTLPRLIIFAILMNFSLFAAQAVIDVSNGLSSALYTQANTDQCGNLFDGGGTTASGSYDDAREQLQNDCIINTGIAGSIMQATGLGSIFQADNGGVQIGASVMIGLALFATIGAVVLFAGAIMLIIRAVVLMLLMVAAPLGFAALAIPPLQKHGEQWWNMLLHQSFFAPVFLLLLLVSLKISETFANTDTTGSLAGALSQPNASVMQIFLVFFLICGLLVASLIAAKRMGAAGATFAVNLGTKYAFGGVARGTNLAVGGTAYGLQRLQQKTGFGGKAGQFVVNRGLRPLSNANLDLRRVPGMGAALGAAGASAGARPGEHISFRDLKHQYEELRDNKRGKELDAMYEKEVATDRLVKELNTNQVSPESERFLAGLSAEEIAANHDLQHSIDKLAERLSPDQFEGMMKSDKVDKNTKDALAAARFEKAKNAVAGGYANKDVVRNLSNKDLEMLAKYDPKTLNDLLAIEDPSSGDSMLSGDQIESLSKSNALTNTQRGVVKAQTKVGRIEAAVKSGSHQRAQQFAGTMSSKAKAKLGADALINPGVMMTLTAGDLAEIQREGKLLPAQIHAITAAVMSPSHPNHTNISNWIQTNPNARGYWR